MTNDPRAYIAAYLKANEITISPEGQLAHSSGKSSRLLFDILFLDYLRDVNNHNDKERRKPPTQRVMISTNGELVMVKALKVITDLEIMANKATAKAS